MAEFTTGQRLTAQGLNQAIAQAAGPANPTGSWKWMGTSSGKLEASWNDFGNSQWQDPDMYTVRISPSLDAPAGLQVNGKPAAALRRVFMYLGATGGGSGGKAIVLSEAAGKGVNGCYYPVAVGWQWRGGASGDEPTPLNRNGIEWSVFSARIRPQADSPSAWAAKQDLYSSQIIRCDSQAGLWWTGITLEDCPSSDLSASRFMDIVAYPVFVKCQAQVDGSSVDVVFPVLCFCTFRDYYGNMPRFENEWQDEISQAVMVEIQAQGFTPVAAAPEPAVPGLMKTVAQYYGRTATQDEHYRQVTNDLSFDFQFGGNVFKGTNDPAGPYPYVLDSFQWEDSKGHHAAPAPALEACGPDGRPVNPELGRLTQNALVACKTQDGAAPIVLTCDWNPDKGDLANWLSSCLSASENLSAADKKLVWLDRGGARGVEWYDMCPDFSGGGEITISGNVDLVGHTGDEFLLSSFSDSRISAQVDKNTGVILLGAYYV